MYASFGRDYRLSCQHITSLLFRRDGLKRVDSLVLHTLNFS